MHDHPDRERDRLRTLAGYGLLDTPPEAVFDEIVRLAVAMFAVPGAAISLLDDHRQWFKSCVGLPVTQTPREDSICRQAVATREFLEVPDATLDPRFRDSPLVTCDGGLRFYAGAPLIVASGQCLGTLCVFDTVPREPMSAAQRAALRDLAHLAVERIEARKDRLRSEIAARVVEATSDAVLAVGRDGIISFWNASAERMFGHDADHALGQTLDLILPDGHLADAYRRGFARAAAGGATTIVGATLELSARRASGDEFPVELSLARWHDDADPGGFGGGGGFAAIVRDISSRKALERDRRDARDFLDSIVAHLPAMLFVKDSATRRYLLLNKAGEDILGMPQSAVEGRTVQELFPDQAGAFDARDDSVLESGSVEQYESDLTRHDGRTVTLRTKRIVIRGADEGQHYILGLSDDVTELRRSERRVLHMAHHDSLTGLLNRASYVERLGEMVASGRRLAVLTIDLDRFKAVNDQFGHLVGDRLLGETADRLRDVAAADDLIFRIGGDEFAIVAVVDDLPDYARILADAVIAALAAPYRIDRFVAHAGASIGIVLAPFDGDTVEALRQAADLALYRAKADGRGAVCFFSAAMDKEAGERRALEADLRLAIDRGEITIAYQPIVSCATGQVTSFEALARWTHPECGPLAPDIFIGIAEECGLIVRLGEYVLREACLVAAQWPAHIKIAVNLSPLQFEQNDLIGMVRTVLADTGLPANRLQLEVTEGLVIRDADHTFRVLAELRSIGVQILLDDFGTGYSSLSYFERFPFDKVKIDRSFVGKLATTPVATAIIRAVIGLGQALGMGIVAEGVETQEQMETLTRLGCTHMQGYLFSRPAPAAAFAHLLHQTENAPERLARQG